MLTQGTAAGTVFHSSLMIHTRVLVYLVFLPSRVSLFLVGEGVGSMKTRHVVGNFVNFLKKKFFLIKKNLFCGIDHEWLLDW